MWTLIGCWLVAAIGVSCWLGRRLKRAREANEYLQNRLDEVLDSSPWWHERAEDWHREDGGGVA